MGEWSVTEEPLFNSPALERFVIDLKEMGISDKSAGFYAGRLVRIATEATAVKFQSRLTEEQLDKFEKMSPGRQQEIMQKVFQHYEGMSVEEYQEQLLDKLVDEYMREEDEEKAT